MAMNAGTMFVHVPKTAGTSLNVLLAVAFGKRLSPPQSTLALTPHEVSGLDRYEMITGHLSGSDIAQYFPQRRLFTVLREPLSRCLSLYGFLRRHVTHPLIPLNELTGANDFVEATSIARQVEPQDFFGFEHPAVSQAVRNRMAWQIGDHARPECRTVASDHEALEQALRNLERFCFVTVLERLDRDLPALFATIGVQSPRKLPRSNATDAPLRPGDVGSETLRAIQRITESDRRLYDAVRHRAEAGKAVLDAA